jgi:aminoglycoside-2''-adenylyltransferase
VGEDQAALREALKRTAAILKRYEMPFALAGGYALWARGGPESTHDVDFMIREADADLIADVLRSAGLAVRRTPEDWLFKVETDGAMVDLLHRAAGDPITDELLDHVEEMEVLSVRMPVLLATDIVSVKLRAMSEHYCDFGPVLAAVRAVREQIDWTRLRAEVSGSAFAAAFLLLVDRLGVSPDGTAGLPKKREPNARRCRDEG